MNGFESLTIKQICNYINAMDKMIDDGVIKFNKNNGEIKLCCDKIMRYSGNKIIELTER